MASSYTHCLSKISLLNTKHPNPTCNIDCHAFSPIQLRSMTSNALNRNPHPHTSPINTTPKFSTIANLNANTNLDLNPYPRLRASPPQWATSTSHPLQINTTNGHEFSNYKGGEPSMNAQEMYVYEINERDRDSPAYLPLSHKIGFSNGFRPHGALGDLVPFTNKVRERVNSFLSTSTH